MRRSVLIILTVAAISGWISRAERAAGDPQPRIDWVRTADGWESRSVLATDQQPEYPKIHPGLIAAFQLTASLLVLVAIPGRAVPVRSAAPAVAGASHSRSRRRALAAGR